MKRFPFATCAALLLAVGGGLTIKHLLARAGIPNDMTLISIWTLICVVLGFFASQIDFHRRSRQ